MTASKVILKCFGSGSVRAGITSKQRKMRVSSGTYPIETVVVVRIGSQSEFETAVEFAAQQLSKKHRAPVWDINDHWGFVKNERVPFDDPIPF